MLRLLVNLVVFIAQFIGGGIAMFVVAYLYIMLCVGAFFVAIMLALEIMSLLVSGKLVGL